MKILPHRGRHLLVTDEIHDQFAALGAEAHALWHEEAARNAQRQAQRASRPDQQQLLAAERHRAAASIQKARGG